MLWLASAAAVLALEIPRFTGLVVDRAELLPPAREAALERELEAYEAQTGKQIVVHTTPSLEGMDIESYGLAIADAWKAGGAKVDTGVILTIAPNERRARIDVGYGLEGVIPDALASRIIRERLIPAIQQGRTADGIEASVSELLRLASGEPSTPPPRRRGERGSLFYLLFLLVFALPYVLPALSGNTLDSRSRVRRRGGFPYGPGGFGGWPRGGGFGGGGFGGGGGGGGFQGGGGGRFGGGGASGSW